MAVHAALELCAPMVIRLRGRDGREEGLCVRRTLKKKKKMFFWFFGALYGEEEGEMVCET